MTALPRARPGRRADGDGGRCRTRTRTTRAVRARAARAPRRGRGLRRVPRAGAHRRRRRRLAGVLRGHRRAARRAADLRVPARALLARAGTGDRRPRRRRPRRVDHPLLAARGRRSGGRDEWLFTGRLSRETQPWLAEPRAARQRSSCPAPRSSSWRCAAGRQVGCEVRRGADARGAAARRQDGRGPAAGHRRRGRRGRPPRGRRSTRARSRDGRRGRAGRDAARPRRRSPPAAAPLGRAASPARVAAGGRRGGRRRRPVRARWPTSATTTGRRSRACARRGATATRSSPRSRSPTSTPTRRALRDPPGAARRGAAERRGRWSAVGDGRPAADAVLLVRRAAASGAAPSRLRVRGQPRPAIRRCGSTPSTRPAPRSSRSTRSPSGRSTRRSWPATRRSGDERALRARVGPAVARVRRDRPGRAALGEVGRHRRPLRGPAARWSGRSTAGAPCAGRASSPAVGDGAGTRGARAVAERTLALLQALAGRASGSPTRGW